MQFTSWPEFFHMGGYALYVWCSFGLSLAVLAAVTLAPVLRHRRLLRELARLERRNQRREAQP